MARNLWFTYVDGREIVATTPREALESLQMGDATAPEDLGRFLDLLAANAQVASGDALDVGVQGDDLGVRCRKALVSLIQQGWLRVLKPEAVWPPMARRALAGDALAYA
jgi:hypothetical protein